ncbi:hypothetical protein PR202_ga15745 [Eleusine coracana subsp. coracana]|uniref:ethanolamine kinase n=1 Tax=Eleusine coracana subsp. coracana TaxID=191504 RepID=A0AAV5CKP9_ELECO|nr:hypothetical protein PR202_ga15745 [Eleusine coracana subsp. coracana]
MGRKWAWNRGAMDVGGGAGADHRPALVAVGARRGDAHASSTSLPLPEMTHVMQVPSGSLSGAGLLAVWGRDLCKELMKGWSSLDGSCFSIETVSGGITNLLLKVSVKEGDGSESSVTVRLYGPNTDLVIDRKRELLAIPYLSAAGFGARLLGIFENGVVQSFINARTLTPSDMKEPKIAATIAKELHKFHQIDIPGLKEPELWNDIFKFLKKASLLKFEDNGKQKQYETISFSEIQDEIKELKDLADLLDAPVVYAHNDLLSGNLMLNDLEDKLYFIDFEYGSYSYRGYDIANHFNEYAGFDCVYDLYPDKDAQYHFFRNYLHADKPSEAKVSPIDFDYLGYFFLRYGEYKKQRDSCLSLAQSFLSEMRNG